MTKSNFIQQVRHEAENLVFYIIRFCVPFRAWTRLWRSETWLGSRPSSLPGSCTELMHLFRNIGNILKHQISTHLKNLNTFKSLPIFNNLRKHWRVKKKFSTVATLGKNKRASCKRAKLTPGTWKNKISRLVSLEMNWSNLNTVFEWMLSQHKRSSIQSFFKRDFFLNRCCPPAFL